MALCHKKIRCNVGSSFVFMNSKLNSMKTILLTLFALITLTIHAQLNSCCSHQQHCTNQNNHYDSYDNSYFTDLRQALLNPEKVKTLDLRNQNLTRLPWEVKIGRASCRERV